MKKILIIGGLVLLLLNAIIWGYWWGSEKRAVNLDFFKKGNEEAKLTTEKEQIANEEIINTYQTELVDKQPFKMDAKSKQYTGGFFANPQTINTDKKQLFLYGKLVAYDWQNQNLSIQTEYDTQLITFNQELKMPPFDSNTVITEEKLTSFQDQYVTLWLVVDETNLKAEKIAVTKYE